MTIHRVAVAALIAASLPVAACQASDATKSHAQSPVADAALKSAVESSIRSAENRARDAHRHPVETLSFFGVKPGGLVVEIYPGAGWYTEILAPYVGSTGSLALVASEQQLSRARQKAAANPEAFSNVLFSPISGWSDATTFPAASADAVLTFRNVHNWHMQGQAADAFKAFYRMLKPGGVLGVVEHRLPESRPDAEMQKSGYLKESYVIEMAQAAGFKLAAKSEINANPKDSADHPEGVWTLPPVLRLKDKDREKYLAIGESDRMTLRFVKPE